MIRPGVREYFRLRPKPERLAQEVEEEIAFHIDQRVRHLVARGYLEADAHAEAERRFGAMARAKLTLQRSATRREYRVTMREWIAGWKDDFRYAARGVRREPFLAIVIILTLSLGIGANAAMFGIIDELLLRGPAHVADSHRVMRMYFTRDAGPFGIRTSSTTGYVEYTMMREDTRDFAAVGAYSMQPATLVGKGSAAEPTTVVYATSDLFPLLGVTASQGRFFNAEEDRPPAGARVAVLDWGYWRSQFGGSDDAIGKLVTVAGHDYTIIGVAPRGFTGPQLKPVSIWMPLSSMDPPAPDWPTTWNAQWLTVVARLKKDVPPEITAGNATTIFRAASREKDPERAAETVSFAALRFDNSGKEATEMTIARWLVGVSVVVLLVACANVANLLLARAVRRRREVGVRLALGISRARLVRLLFSEALLLSCAGTIGALAVANWGGRLMRTALLPSIQWSESPVSSSVLLYAVLAMILTAVMTGFAPAFEATRQDLLATLRGGTREGGITRSPLRSALTVLQAAFSVLLLVGAGLFIHSLWQIGHLKLGIDPDKVLAVGVTWTPLSDTTTAGRKAEKARRNGVLLQASHEIARRSDVEHASVSVGTPLLTGFGVDLRVPGYDSVPSMPGGGPFISAVASDYFETVGTHLLNGRTFTPADRDGSEPVAIVNLTMARTLWHRDAPIGECIFIGDEGSPCARIVGVVEDARRNELREESAFQYYIPYGQERGFGGTYVVVRPRAGMEAALRRELSDVMLSLGAGVSNVTVKSLQEKLDPQIRPWKLGATMFCIFGALALLIAAIGLFSVIAYSVAQRRIELGIRLALGARGASVVALILKQGLTLTIAGIAIGFALAIAAGRYLAPMLFDTSPRDPATFAIVCVVLLMSATAACILPAARAGRIDPATALHAD